MTKYLLTLFLIFPVVGNTQSYTEACDSVSNVASVLVPLRDSGVHFSQVYLKLLSLGVPEEVAQMLVYFVYKKHPTASAEDIHSLYYLACLGESV